MSLTNAQYDEIMRQYSRKQLKAQETARKKKKQLYSQAPELSQIDAAIASVSVSCARSYIRGEKALWNILMKKYRLFHRKKKRSWLLWVLPQKIWNPPMSVPCARTPGT